MSEKREKKKEEEKKEKEGEKKEEKEDRIKAILKKIDVEKLKTEKEILKEEIKNIIEKLEGKADIIQDYFVQLKFFHYLRTLKDAITTENLGSIKQTYFDIYILWDGYPTELLEDISNLFILLDKLLSILSQLEIVKYFLGGI
jgi:hypothetical protein